MGKVASRMWTRGNLGGFGNPQPADSLKVLVNWSRESLVSAFEDFRRMPKASLTLDINSFWRILQFESRSAAEGAFNDLKLPKKDRVDFLSVIGAMVATSNQRFISKVSFLFSIYDLDSSGSINRAEFFIAARSLIMGLSRFFTHAMVPTQKKLEEMTNDVFDRIDDDASGLIMLGELIAFAYRNKEFQALLAPFSAEDPRIFEELVTFASVSEPVAEAGQHAVNAVEEKLRHKLNTAPDPGRRRSSNARPPMQQRVWKQPKQISKAQTWVMWRVYKSLAGENSHILACSELRSLLKDHAFMVKLLDNISSLAAELASETGEVDNNFEADKAAVKKLCVHLEKYFQDPGAISRLDTMAEGSISLRAFYCILLPHVPESEIESCLAWCKKFVAHKLLTDILKDPTHMKVEREDLHALFKVVDKDGDGSITMDELCNVGMLRREEGEKLMSDWDKDGSGQLNESEVKAVLVRMDSSLRNGFRNAFSTKDH